MEPTVRIRLDKSEVEYWTEQKICGGLQTYNDVVPYLLDPAELTEQNAIPR